MAKSEAAAWREVQGIADELRGMSLTASTRAEATRFGSLSDRLATVSREMAEQVGRGVHENPRGRMKKNPGLVIWPNPGSMLAITFDKILSRRAIALQYKHVADKLDYQHDFDAGVDVVTALTDENQRVVVLTARDGRELWADF